MRDLDLDPGGSPLMRKLRLFLFFGLFLYSGCRGIEGPRYHKQHPEQFDNPNLTIEDQKRRSRDLIALPEGNQNFGPKTYTETYGPNGRW